MEETKKETYFKLDITIVFCIMMVLISAIIGYCYYSIKDREFMSNNIQSAIEKGIDPMSVRCSYAKVDDTICVAFAVTHNSTNPAVVMSKK
jgi:hypothetical protein